MAAILKCCIKGCPSDGLNATLFEIAKSPNDYNIWIQLMKPHLTFNLESVSENYVKRRCLCIRHFEKRFLRGAKRIPRAFPTLFTEEEIRTGEPKICVQIANSLSSSNLSTLDNEETLEALTSTGPLSENQRITTINVCTANTLQGTQISPNFDYSDTLVATPSTSSANLSQCSPMPLTPGHNDNLVPSPSTANQPQVSPSPPTLDYNNTFVPPPTTGTKSAKKRCRLVKSVNTLTPKCRKIYQRYLKIAKSKRQLTYSFKERIDKAKKTSEKASFDFMIQKLSPSAKIFLSMQISQCNKHIKRRRFSAEEKLLSLSLLKQSPKGYNLLQRIFILPSKRTLNKFTQNVQLKPGINNILFAQLKETVETWTAQKRLCSILFDEISLAPHLTFVESEDTIEGFVNFGKNNLQKFSDHALVFMVRGICGSWKQPIAFYFCEGTTPSAMLKTILQDIVTAVVESGLVPIAIVCDQGSTFQTTIKNLRDEYSENKILIKNHKLNVIYDPPHLIKGIRNNFLTKDLLFLNKIAKWRDIIEVYKADCELGDIRMLSKLTDEHVIPKKIKKMKVKNCTQVLSERTSAMLQYTSRYEKHPDGRPVSTTMKNTAEAVLFFDRLFDSVNGSRHGAAPGKLRGAVHDVAGESKHVKHWREAIRTLQNIYYLVPNKSFPDNISKKQVPSLRNWIVTLKSFIEIWFELKRKGVKFFYPRNLNQDPLENFFGRVRALNYRNNNPDCYTFQRSFKSLLITNVLAPHSLNANCEDDNSNFIFKSGLSLMFNSNQRERHDSPQPNLVSDTSSPNIEREAPVAFSSGLDKTPTTLFYQVQREKINVHASAFTAGFVSRKLIKKLKCKSCKNTFLTPEISEIHRWISLRERKLLKGKNLNYPSPKFVMLFRDLINTINEYLNNFAQNKDLVKNIRTSFLNSASTDWLGCQTHHEEAINYFIILICRVQIHHWCKIINKILQGAFSEKLGPNMTYLQRLAYNKYRLLRGRN